MPEFCGYEDPRSLRQRQAWSVRAARQLTAFSTPASNCCFFVLSCSRFGVIDRSLDSSGLSGSGIVLARPVWSQRRGPRVLRLSVALPSKAEICQAINPPIRTNYLSAYASRLVRPCIASLQATWLWRFISCTVSPCSVALHRTSCLDSHKR